MCITLTPDSTTLGIAFMDDAHDALHRKLDQFSALSDDAFASAFEELIENVRAHFAEEEQAMQAIDFAGTSCHRGQHVQALSALHHALQRIREGAIAEGREVIGLFSQWLNFHIGSMDAMLALVMRDVQAEKASCVAA
ncbi:hemerythrin-like metal-binding domain protein [Noviherbaspirillum humi]|uniref:Hemerythrin-like metal-binding domain protein n=1 Tax=Noviherbaspirillum humi TaxID=1688639 RepID=A0A239LZE2_9BURK|nr:hemerythrin domain-containing protein [Noviherbaspirillum humi]SNT35997.1 hemerythrin-like metal-binding domain protein [Noviherbaspirillum humi]